MLGLMKISTYHKEKGDNVDFVKGYSTLKQLDMFSNNDDILNLKPSYDKIYITITNNNVVCRYSIRW